MSDNICYAGTPNQLPAPRSSPARTNAGPKSEINETREEMERTTPSDDERPRRLSLRTMSVSLRAALLLVISLATASVLSSRRTLLSLATSPRPRRDNGALQRQRRQQQLVDQTPAHPNSTYAPSDVVRLAPAAGTATANSTAVAAALSDASWCRAAVLRDDNVSHIFLHVGPDKTGTTSIQNYLACHGADLQKHNTHFLGKVNPRDTKGCAGVPQDFVRPMVQYKSEKGMERLRREIESHVARRRHVVLSDEAFVTVPTLVGRLFGGMNATLRYNVVLLSGYREYYEWVKSFYNYYNAVPKPWERGWRRWDLGGVNVRTFPDFWNHCLNVTTFREFWNNFRQKHGDAHPAIRYADAVRAAIVGASAGGERDGASVPRVCTRFLDLRGDGDAVKQVEALIAGRTPSSGGGGGGGGARKARANVHKAKRFAADSERLALKLKAEGLVDDRAKRRRVVGMVQKKMAFLYDASGEGSASGNGAPPLRCLDAVQDRDLWNITRESERVVWSATRQNETSLRYQFRQSFQDQAYCNIVLDEMLKEEGWRTVLPCLKEREKKAAELCWYKNHSK